MTGTNSGPSSPAFGATPACDPSPAIRRHVVSSPRAGLSCFLDDGRVEIDNNTVERAIRPLALTRKNALFAGSDDGAGHWAVVASLVETYKLNEVEPQAYLTDVVTRIVAGHPQSHIDDLLPWAYAPQSLKAVA